MFFIVKTNLPPLFEGFLFCRFGQIWFKPSTSVVINTITANCPAAGVNNEQVTADGTTVFTANDPAYIGPVSGLAQGQQWNFSIVGKVGSSNGASYTATANITIQ